MCGRFTVFSSPGDLARLFAVDTVRVGAPLPPRFNIAPTLEVYAVVDTPEGERRLGTLRWGGAGPINARAETIADKPMFRAAFRRRRCLIPADGFYEWVDGTPHLIRRRDGQPLAFAGIWDRWNDGVPSCVIVTTAARGFLTSLHDRMPVVLGPDDWDAWLDAQAPAPLDVTDVDVLEAFPVSRAVNDVRNDGPHLIERAAS